MDALLIDRRKVFGKWLRNCRKQAHITQSELATALGYDSSQLISNIERGMSLLPSKKIPDFAKALGCSLLEIEVRYFQCSARNSSEGRMPDLLLKYLPVIEALEYGNGTDQEIIEAVARSRQEQPPTDVTGDLNAEDDQDSHHHHQSSASA